MASLAVQEQSFSSVWAKGRIQLTRYAYILRKRWWVLVLTISLGLCGGAWFVSQLPPAYLSVGRMMVSGQIRLGEGTGYSEELVNFFGTQVELMQSPEIRKRALARVQALHPEFVPEPVKLDVAQVPRASIFMMRAIGQSPVFTQTFLDACLDEYVATKKEMRSQKSESTTAAIQDELVRLEKEMQAEEEEMHEFQKQNNIGFLHEEGNSAGVYLAQLNRQLADLKTEYDLLALLDLDQNLDRGTPTAGAVAAAGSRDATTMQSYGPIAEYQKAKQQLEMLKQDREDFSRYLRPKHPTIVNLDEQITRGEKLIEAFRAQSVETLKTRRESIRLQIQNIEGITKEWDAKAVDLSRRIAEFDKIKSKAERTKSQYDRLLTTLRSVDVTKNVDQDTISILERASQPLSVKPGLPKIMWEGFGIGLLFGMVILFVMDKLDDRIGSFIELRSNFPEELLGQIPREDMTGELGLIKAEDTRHALLESFRTLRSSVLFLPVSGVRPKVLMFTSAIPAEGKTTVAANFAVTLAFAGAKTLIIDADLRRGRLAELFGVSKEGGLSKVLHQRLPWKEAILNTQVENLFVLPRGKALNHPAEHLLGKVMDQLLQETYKEFDYIILDSAPVLVADDALSLGPKADGVIFVVRFSQSSARMSRRAIDLLAKRQANLLGVVANHIKHSQSEYGYGHYYQYSETDKETGAEAEV